MAISSAQIAALPDYTDAEIVKMYRAAILAVSLNQSYSLMGRNVTRANLQDLRETLEYFEQRVNAGTDSDTGGGVALVQYGERV